MKSEVQSKKKKNLISALFTLKITVTVTKIDSSHESGNNFITWAWPASTTVIYNNPVYSVNVVIICFKIINPPPVQLC
jgi:hypothetical protein